MPHSIRQKKVYATYGYTAATKTEVFCSEVAEAGRG